MSNKADKESKCGFILPFIFPSVCPASDANKVFCLI